MALESSWMKDTYADLVYSKDTLNTTIEDLSDFLLIDLSFAKSIPSFIVHEYVGFDMGLNSTQSSMGNISFRLEIGKKIKEEKIIKTITPTQFKIKIN